MAKIHEIAKQENASLLITTPESHHGAIGLYKKLGYEEEDYYMADDEVNKASCSFLRNRFERYFLRLKMKKFLFRQK